MIMSYEQRRYENLKETIDEYLGSDGEGCTSENLISDIRRACMELKVFHEKCLNDYNSIEKHFGPS